MNGSGVSVSGSVGLAVAAGVLICAAGFALTHRDPAESRSAGPSTNIPPAKVATAVELSKAFESVAKSAGFGSQGPFIVSLFAPSSKRKGPETKGVSGGNQLPVMEDYKAESRFP